MFNGERYNKPSIITCVQGRDQEWFQSLVSRLAQTTYEEAFLGGPTLSRACNLGNCSTPLLIITPTTQVLDLTELILANRGPLADPLIAAAGTDVTHWFSPSSIALAADGNSKSDSRQAGVGGSESKDGSRKGQGEHNGDLLTGGDPRTRVDPQTGLTVPYLPMGR